MQICRQNIKKLTESFCSFFTDSKRKAILGALFLTLLCLWIAVEQATSAGPVDLFSGTAPAPLGVTSGRLASEIVDATVEEVDGRTFVVVESRFFIENMDRLKPQVLTISLPAALPDGLIFSPDALTDFVIEVDGQSRDLQPLQSDLPATGEVITSAYTLALDSPAGKRVLVSLNYRQDIGNSAKPTFRFAHSIGSRWPGPVDSARIALEFPWPTTLEQILAIQPAEMTFDGQRITWYDSEFEPAEDVMITFIKPCLWQAIREARLLVTQNPRSAEAHYDLASLYQSLLSTGPMTGSLLSLQSLMIAELESVKQTADLDNVSVLCNVHQKLSTFFWTTSISLMVQ